MRRAAKEAPHGDTWIFRDDELLDRVTFEIWDGHKYMPVYGNNGLPDDFRRELFSCRTQSQMRKLGERTYRAGL